MTSFQPLRSNILGSPFDNLSKSATLARIEESLKLKQFMQHCVINVAKVIHMRKDLALQQAVSSCDLISVDGMGVVWGARFLGIPVTERVAGIDLFFSLLELAEKNNHPVFLLGAKAEVLELAVANLQQRYPQLQIVGNHHGYFWGNEAEIVDKIRQSGAEMLFVAITSPKKEVFIEHWKSTLGVTFVMGVGGTFDIVAGITRRAPLWMQKNGLEWFFRALQEPRRMWQRYFLTNTLFLFALLNEKLKLLLQPPK